ncbi:MAG: ABC transporter permease [Acidobacteriota bacterium]
MWSRLRAALSRVGGFVHARKLDRDFAEELEAHLAMAEEEKVRQGLPRREARRLARVELGGLTQLREAGRDARGLPAIDTFWLDVKLGLRMLRKSWGLTLVGGLAMTLAIGIGVFVFWFLEMSFFPTLPLPDGDRIVALQTWDDEGHRRRDTPMEDVVRWRDSLRSLEDFGAFQSVRRNLVTEDGWSPVTVAEMTASGFRLTRVPPLLGRPLVPGDEAAGAPPVVVLGHAVWRSRFGADPEVVGSRVHFGETAHTVVGVMPEGFEFPLDHGFWTPLRIEPHGSLRDAGPEGVVFARLAPGVSQQTAEAELIALGLLEPRGPSADERLRPRLVPYAFAFTGDFEPGETPWMVRLVLAAVLLLLVPPCANIAILVYARTIARQQELASRFALGASRCRIVVQLFLEVLVLAAAATGVALALARLAGQGLRDTLTRQGAEGIPFWIDFNLSFKTVLFAAFLALVAAAVAGVVPALQATGRRMQSSFRALGSHGQVRLGRTWNALVVVQVALTLAVLPSAAEMAWGTMREGVLGPGFDAESYLTARLDVDAGRLEGFGSIVDDRSPEARFADLRADLLRLLRAESQVLGVSTASAVPGDEPWAAIEVEGVTLSDGGLLDNRDLVRFNHVDAGFFELFGNGVRIGRGFDGGDLEPARRSLIVDQTFADTLLGGQNPLGRRVRYTKTLEGEPLGPAAVATWYEIVGVVAPLPEHGGHGTIYHPRIPGDGLGATLLMRTAVDPSVVAERLRELTAAVDPALRLDKVLPLGEIYRGQQVGNNMGVLSLTAVTLSVLLLSAAGIYALMSFTVNQRRREIGIRAALGARPRTLLLGILRRALGRVGVGALVGSLLALGVDRVLPIEQAGGWSIPGVVPAAAAFMGLVALAAAAGPALRGLRVDPIEELREG